MHDTQQLAEEHIVEDFGLAFEQTGMPRMSGRIIGSLLISDPPHQSMDQLVGVLTSNMFSSTQVPNSFTLISDSWAP